MRVWTRFATIIITLCISMFPLGLSAQGWKVSVTALAGLQVECIFCPPEDGDCYPALCPYSELSELGNAQKWLFQLRLEHEEQSDNPEMVINLALDGTAQFSEDYEFVGLSGDAVPFSLNYQVPAKSCFLRGYCTHSLIIGPIDDLAVEGDETIVLTVLDGEGYVVTDGDEYTASLVLRDDEEQPSDFSINAGMNGAWFDPAEDGQGILFEVFPDSNTMFVTWFTYERKTKIEQPDGSSVIGDDKHRWLSAQGGYDGNKAELKLYSLPDGKFGEKNEHRKEVGTMELVFSDCRRGQMTFRVKSDDGQNEISGTNTIQRVAEDNVPLCEALDEELRQAD